MVVVNQETIPSVVHSNTIKSTSNPLVVEEVDISSIKIRFRLRTPKEERIEELSSSIETLGLLNPITVDNENYLIAGFHRLSAYKFLNKTTIPCIRKDFSRVYAELGEIDENLKRIDLDYIEMSEHIVRREELLEELGVRMKNGDNQYSGELVTTTELAEELGISNRMYRLKRQVYNITEEVRDTLKGAEWAKVLMDMVKLSQLNDDLQMKVCKLLISGKYRSFKQALIKAGLEDYRKDVSYKIDFNMKERWGIPSSIMNFKKSGNEMQGLCDLIGKDPDCQFVKSQSLLFGTSEIPVYQMSADLAEFLVTYYTPEGGLILDNFMGRGTIGLSSLCHGRRFVGYDVVRNNIDKFNEVAGKNLEGSEGRYEVFHSDGIELNEFKDKSEYFDAVVTDPPYCLKNERYSKSVGGYDHRDLSNMNHKEYMERIRVCFTELHRLVKTSCYEDKKFYPMIWKTGTGRSGPEGIYDMDFDFQKIAKDTGWVLWDKLFNQVRSPYASTNWERNYFNKYVSKNYECNLVFVKFKKEP